MVKKMNQGTFSKRNGEPVETRLETANMIALSSYFRERHHLQVVILLLHNRY